MSAVRWCSALIAGMALASCYGSNGQTKDGQSHWLERCSTRSDCADDRICACGVCTIECDANAACGEHGACTVLEDIAQCSAPAAVVQACLQRCGEDDDCGASGIECIEQRCVVTVGEGSEDGRARVDTIEGRLTCAEVRSLQTDQLAWLDEAHAGECLSAADCTCADASTPCAIECGRPVPRSHLSAYESDVASFSADYCSDPSIRASCGTSVNICVGDGECAVNCVSGRCMATGRSSCLSGGVFAGCGLGEICHIDNTCIDRMMADENGVETLAIGRQMGTTGEPSPWGSILDVAATDDAIYWIDVGTGTLGNIAPTDAALFRLSLATAAETMLSAYVTYLAEDLFVDDQYAYYYQDGDLRASSIDGFGPALGASIGSGRTPGPWTVGGTGVIYLTQGGTSLVQRMEIAMDGTTMTDVVSFGDDRQVVSLSFAEGALFVETNVYLEAYTTLHTVDLESGEATELVATFRDINAATSRTIVHQRMVLSTDVSGEVRGHDIASGELTTYAGGNAALRSASEGYAYYVQREGDAGPYAVTRAELSSGATEALLTTMHEVGDVIARDDQLFWVENARLLRKRIRSSIE